MRRRGWTDATWNIITGCSVVSPGCTNCYAMKLAGTRLKHHPSRAGLTIDTKAGPVWNGQVRFNVEWLDQPLRWTKPRKIFVCAHGDLFHEDVQDAWIVDVYAVMVAAHHLRGHVFQVLTKRSDRARQLLSSQDFWDQVNALAAEEVMERTDPLERRTDDARATLDDYGPESPPPGIWFGASVEDQRRADERTPDLLATPAAVRWVSAEPLLGPIDLTSIRRFSDGMACKEYIDALRGTYWTDQTGLPNPDPRWAKPGVPFNLDYDTFSGIDWVVAGGESGPGSRPMHPAWARALRDQCAAAGVAFLFKQWGDWGPACELDTDALDSRLYHPAPKARPEASRRPKTPQTVLHANGDRFDDVAARGAYQAGSGAMLMFDVGKAVTGRTLDGRIHDGFPRHDARICE